MIEKSQTMGELELNTDASMQNYDFELCLPTTHVDILQGRQVGRLSPAVSSEDSAFFISDFMKLGLRMAIRLFQ